MTPGRVVRMRVNPRDCMSIVDILDLLEFTPTNISFDHACSLALSTLLESARTANLIPKEREGFEYSNMLSRFGKVTKADIAKRVALTTISNQAPPEHRASSFVHSSPPPMPHSAEPDFAKRQIRYNELKFKLDHAMESMTEDDISEYAILADEFAT